MFHFVNIYVHLLNLDGLVHSKKCCYYYLVQIYYVIMLVNFIQLANSTNP